MEKNIDQILKEMRRRDAVYAEQRSTLSKAAELYFKENARGETTPWWCVEWFLRDALYLCIRHMMLELGFCHVPLGFKYGEVELIDIVLDEHNAVYINEDSGCGRIDTLPLENPSNEMWDICKLLMKILEDKLDDEKNEDRNIITRAM